MNVSAKCSSIHTIPRVIEEALKKGIPQNVMEAAQRSPVYKMAMDSNWRYRYLNIAPCRWSGTFLRCRRFSPTQMGRFAKSQGVLPAIESLRIPVQYLANMLSAGDTGPVLRALKRMMAMRHYMRSQTVEGVTDTRAIDEVGLSVAQVEEICIVTSPLPTMKIVLSSRRAIGKWRAMPSQNATLAVFTFGDGCHGSDSKLNLFNSSRIDAINITEVRDKAEGE